VARALLLNASFEPLCVVPARRAVVLVLKEKAEIVDRNGAVFRSERRTVPVPTVIRRRRLFRVGPCLRVTRTAVSTADARPRTSITSSRVRAAVRTRGRTSWRRADRATPAKKTVCLPSAAWSCAAHQPRRTPPTR
jgi:hypothetical protein